VEREPCGLRLLRLDLEQRGRERFLCVVLRPLGSVATDLPHAVRVKYHAGRLVPVRTGTAGNLCREPSGSALRALAGDLPETYVDKAPSHYEEDHLISLELGGNPRDPKNLWP